jgi:hypothetical protein
MMRLIEFIGFVGVGALFGGPIGAMVGLGLYMIVAMYGEGY